MQLNIFLGPFEISFNEPGNQESVFTSANAVVGYV